MKPPIIVFDLDGTLVDTAPDLLVSLNTVLDAEGLEPIAPKALRAVIGHGGRAMLQRTFEQRGAPLSEDRLDTLIAAFLDHYRANMPGQSRPFDGVRACIDRFATAGYQCAVCTNKQEAPSKTLLELLELSPSFAAICGPDTFGVRKPDPEHLTRTIALAGGDPERAIMIGDSITDANTAKAAGIPVVVVDFGYATEPVAQLGADSIISHFDELTVAVADALIEQRHAARV